MGTAEKGYTNLGKGLNPYKRPSGMSPDTSATSSQIESEKAAVESGRGKGGDPHGSVANVVKYNKK